MVASSTPAALAEWLLATTVDVAFPEPSWNVAPQAELTVAATGRSGRRLGVMRWGLVPSWSTDPSGGPRPINARAETIADRTIFAGALSRRRCIVPVDGFYEWKRGPDGRAPHYASAIDGAPLALAAIWDRRPATTTLRDTDYVDRENADKGDKGERDALATFAIVTTTANTDMVDLHDRMPVILKKSDWDEWLDPATNDVEEIMRLLVPAPAGMLGVREVSGRVNSAHNDDPSLLDVHVTW